MNLMLNDCVWKRRNNLQVHLGFTERAEKAAGEDLNLYLAAVCVLYLCCPVTGSAQGTSLAHGATNTLAANTQTMHKQFISYSHPNMITWYSTLNSIQYLPFHLV